MTFSKITPACLYWTLFAVLYLNIETILLHVNTGIDLTLSDIAGYIFGFVFELVRMCV